MSRKEKIAEVYGSIRQRREKSRITSYDKRKSNLGKLLEAIYSNEKTILTALKSDLNKSFTEGKIIEFYPVVSEIKHALHNLKKWMSPQRVSTPITQFGSRSKIIYDPKGLALIMSPWNYPFLLSMSPVVSAIAAGNSIILKPSEKSKNTSGMLKDLLAKVFTEDEVAVIEGGQYEAEELLKLKFDHMFFTGSPKVGKLVMEAAAKQLTSVTLELGGKSPVIVDGTYDIVKTAKRIAWGKLINAGQTCIAPDYLIVKESLKNKLADEIINQFKKQYNVDGNFYKSEEYSRIINKEHTERFKTYLENEKVAGSLLKFGGNVLRDEKYVEPTVLIDVKPDNPVMEEEIFGPLLPVITYKEIEDVVSIIKHNPNPLSLYIFSRNENFISYILEECPSGGVVVNDTLLHFANANLPFGGIQNSGIGKAHGHYGFLEFTNQRAVVRQSRWTPASLIYPPYVKWKQRLADIIVKYF